MTAVALRTGKLPAVYDPGAILYREYLKVTPVPSKVNPPPITAWGMLGNDDYGDCFWAGSDHETMRWNHDAGKNVTFKDANALADYAAATGFKPTDPNTDAGTEVVAGYKYRRKTGVIDAHSRRHRLGAYVSIEPGHQAHVEQAIWELGAAGVGVRFPQSAMDQFNKGKPWSVVPGPEPQDGHYIPAFGYDLTYLYVVTWGRIQAMTWAFFRKYCDEAFGLLSSEFLTKGLSPAGFDLKQLTHDLSSLA